MKKSSLATIIIILVIIAFAFYIKTKPVQATSEEIAKCMGKNSILYIQLGCHACKIQEDLFGENYQYLNVVDCFYESQECIDKHIEVTPTWIINGEKIRGAQSIKKLQELTGC